MQRTISAVESNSVPSQSKTIEVEAAWCASQRAPAGVAHRRAAARPARRARRSPGGRTPAGARAGTCARSGAGPRAIWRLSAKSPYLGSPTIGWPLVRQVDADLVRAAGLQRHVEQRVLARSAAPPCTSVIERRPSAWSAATARTWRSPCGVEGLVQRHVDDLRARRPGAEAPARRRSCPCRARGTGPAARSARCASWPAAARPRFPCPAGARVRGTCACGRARRNCSMTPKLTPEPPCTATPAGLSMASRCSSSSRTANSRGGTAASASGRGRAHRRHAHLVAQRQPRVGRGAALVDAHLARADDAVDVGLGHALQHAEQEVVQPLARRCPRRPPGAAPCGLHGFVPGRWL